MEAVPYCLHLMGREREHKVKLDEVTDIVVRAMAQSQFLRVGPTFLATVCITSLQKPASVHITGILTEGEPYIAKI